MFAGLGHRTVGSRNNENRAVHLSRAGNHVLDVVSVTRAVDVRIVAFFGFVFDVGGVNCDTAFAFFRRLVDVFVGFVFREALLGENFRDSRSKRRFAVVDVSNRTNVHVRFTAVKFLLCQI